MARTFDALDEEWARVARSEEAREALRRWSSQHAVFRGAADLDVLMRRRRNPQVARRLLAALAERAPAEPLAARALLQALLPGLLSLAGTIGYDDPEAPEELVALAWVRIRSYPSSREGSVAGNVLLDVRKDYRRHTLGDRRTRVRRQGELPVAPVPSAEEAMMTARSLDDVMAELREAERAGVISASALRLIVMTRVEGASLEEAAIETNEPASVIKVRRWRAERRLRERYAEAS